MTLRGFVDRSMDRSKSVKQAFALMLKEARGKLGMTKSEIARELKLKDMAVYWNYEAGRNLPANLAEKERIEHMVETLLAELAEQEKVAPQETEVAIKCNKEPVEKSPQVEGPAAPETQEEFSQREPLYEDKTLHEQLQDLGVEIKTVPSLGLRPDEEKPHKPGIRWYNSQKVNDAYLYNKVSITKGDVRLGKAVCERLLKVGKYMHVGVTEKNGRQLLILKPVTERTTGTLAICNKNSSARLGSKALLRWLEAQGLTQGRYTVRKATDAENTFVGVPEGE